jgi:hypothetical protein
MPNNFKIDQGATFEHLILMSTAPKMKPKTSQQDTDRDGRPKWEVQVAAGFHQFGRVTNEILKVGMVSEKDPGQGIPPLSPVNLIDFEIGIMERTNSDGNVIGHQVWYRASGMKANAATK